MIAGSAEPDPFHAAAIRGLDHHAHLAPTDLVLQAVVLSRRNLQPYFCLSAPVERAFEELIPDLHRGSKSSPSGERYKPVDVAVPGCGRGVLPGSSADPVC